MKVNTNVNIIIRISIVLFVLLIAWFFTGLILYIFLAFILSLIGKPIAKLINRIKIYKYHIPFGFCALLTLFVMVMFFGLIFIFISPMLTREARVIAEINYEDLSRNLSYLLDNVQDFLYNNNIIEEHETLVGIVTNEIREFASITNFSNILGGIVSTAGSFVIGLFAVFFLTFFFIKDDISLDGVARLLFGEKHAERLTPVSEKITNLLSRYYTGLVIEIFSMITLLYIGMTILGVKGALLIAFFGGIFNAIPYIGPLIGITCACLFGSIDCLSVNDYQAITPTLLKIIGTFVSAILIDVIVMQPIIYSRSVKTHPVEIFLVIIMGGSLAGIPGMLFAVPVYTMLRTIVIEIFKYVKTQ